MPWKQAKLGFAPAVRRTACHLGFRLRFPASVDPVGQPKCLLPFWDGSEKALIALGLVTARVNAILNLEYEPVVSLNPRDV